MSNPVIGWERTTLIPDMALNGYLNARQGRLYFEDLDLTQLLIAGREEQGLNRTLHSPLELVYLPKIRQQIAWIQQVFATVSQEVGYSGKLLYAYPSKANTAVEVVRTVLDTGVHYEISSVVDSTVVRLMMNSGHFKPDKLIVCNGFKPAGTAYAEHILQLRKDHMNVIPVIEDFAELSYLVDSKLNFDVGLRQKSYGAHADLQQMDRANSRFGFQSADLFRAAELVAKAPNLNLRLYHAMVGSQVDDEQAFVERLTPPIEIYAQLRQRYPSLDIFDLGGGVPVAMTLNFDFDYSAWLRLLLTTIKETCSRHQVPVPDVMGEFGRFTVSEHGAHFFKVLTVKENGSELPWYIINGSIMTSFPDVWALGEHFIVLPLNHLDQPFRRVQLGGITCDSDYVYPPKHSQTPLYLPVNAEDLYIGFFSIGAYQEMLGGVGGTKHCVIPEANELVVDRDSNGHYIFQVMPGQSTQKVLANLGYSFS